MVECIGSLDAIRREPLDRFMVHDLAQGYATPVGPLERAKLVNHAISHLAQQNFQPFIAARQSAGMCTVLSSGI